MKYLCLCKRPRVFLLNGTSVPSFLGMVWVYTTDVRVIHDVVRSLRSGAVQKPSWEGTVGCLEAWTPLLTYQTRPSFPFSGSNRPLFSFLGFFSSTHSNFLVSFSCIVDSDLDSSENSECLWLCSPTGRRRVVMAAEERPRLDPGLWGYVFTVETS